MKKCSSNNVETLYIEWLEEYIAFDTIEITVL